VIQLKGQHLVTIDQSKPWIGIEPFQIQLRRFLLRKDRSHSTGRRNEQQQRNGQAKVGKNRQ
jgi:hypothetical protein